MTRQKIKRVIVQMLEMIGRAHAGEFGVHNSWF